jgi:uroporphyrin-3 C-methyltransferase
MNDAPQPDLPVTPAPEQAARAPAPGTASLRLGALPALLIALVALGLSAWQWYGDRGEIGSLRQDLARKLAELDTQAKESRIISEQAREAVAEAQVKLGVLESRIADSQNQQIALEALYQDLSRNRDEWAYAEIEQSLFIASQQLQLAGNVKGALIALQTADARLQKMDRPQLVALRKAINRDIDRLKTAPLVDTVAISVRLDGIITQADGMPLAMETRPPQEPAVAAPQSGEGNLWTRFWRDAWAEMRQLVRVQQMDRPDVPILAPAQAYFLRENLKLRLIGARLALLSRDSASYKADLKAARDWLGRYYDAGNSAVAHALNVLRGLHDADVSIEVPDISGTLEALRNLRLTRERGTR